MCGIKQEKLQSLNVTKNIETFGLWSLLTDVIILYFYAIVGASEKKQELVIKGSRLFVRIWKVGVQNML